MCSNYSIVMDFADLLYGLGAENEGEFVWPDLVRPTDPAPVAVAVDGRLVMLPMQFSMVPAWSKVRRPKFATHNARVETMADKPTWREPLRRRRCLVPMTGFVEPVYEGEFAGKMVRFAAAQEPLLVAAGVWDRWVDRDSGDEVRSFAVVTGQASEFVQARGHDRQPVFLRRESWQSWVGGGVRGSSECIQELQIGAADWGDGGVATVERDMAKGWERRRKK